MLTNTDYDGIISSSKRNRKQNLKKEIHSIHSIYKCSNEKDENKRKVRVIPLGKNL